MEPLGLPRSARARRPGRTGPEPQPCGDRDGQRLFGDRAAGLVGEGNSKAMMEQFVDYKPSEWKEKPLDDFVCFYVD